MRLSIGLLAVSCWLSAVSAQWLERTIHLPSEYRLPGGWRHLTYNPWHRVMYIAADGSDTMLVMDADRCRLAEKVPVGYGVTGMASPHDRDVLYLAQGPADLVSAFNCETHQLTSHIRVGDYPGALLSCDQVNKLYVANWGDHTVSVIDCRAESVVATIPDIDANEIASSMCYAERERRVFCIDMADSAVVVVDASADTVVARIHVGASPAALCFNPANGRVYCSCWGDRKLYVIDCWSSAVVSVIDGGFASRSLACDARRNVVYVPYGDQLILIDGSADTIAAWIELEAGSAELVFFSHESDMAFVAHAAPG